MARGKGKNISNRYQGYLSSSEPSSATRVIPGYPNSPEKQDSYLKSHFMMMIENFKKDINNSLKEMKKNKGKQLEAIKEETQKSLKELLENTNKQVKGLNKTIQDLKLEIETIKKARGRQTWR
jgi:DNA anti-recombination protein RmuC